MMNQCSEQTEGLVIRDYHLLMSSSFAVRRAAFKVIVAASLRKESVGGSAQDAVCVCVFTHGYESMRRVGVL